MKKSVLVACLLTISLLALAACGKAPVVTPTPAQPDVSKSPVADVKPTISVNDITASAGELIMVEISVSADSTICALDAQLSFDTDVLAFVEKDSEKSFPAGASSAADIGNGVIKMSMATVDPPKDETVLFALQFRVNDGVDKDVVSALGLTVQTCCNYDMVDIIPEVKGGSLTVK